MASLPLTTQQQLLPTAAPTALFMAREASDSKDSSGHWVSENITIQTSDGGEILVEKELLKSHSKFWSDMLSTCDTGRITIDESKESFELLLQVLQNQTPIGTFDTRDASCWEKYKKILVIADKYDVEVARERCEKWLLARCLRGKVRAHDFKFHDVCVGQEWLLLCCKYGLRDLGWFVAYDLGLQLRDSAFPSPVGEFLAGVNDPELLKVMLEAVADAAPPPGLTVMI